MTWEQG